MFQNTLKFWAMAPSSTGWGENKTAQRSLLHNFSINLWSIRRFWTDFPQSMAEGSIYHFHQPYMWTPPAFPPYLLFLGINLIDCRYLLPVNSSSNLYSTTQLQSSKYSSANVWWFEAHANWSKAACSQEATSIKSWHDPYLKCIIGD